MKCETVQPELSITPRALEQRLQRGIPTDLVDVRTPSEYAAAHLRDATLIPLDELDVKRFLNTRKDAQQPLFIICQSGSRARIAVQKFAREGFTNCVVVEGGMQACLQSELPVQQGSSRILPLMQQVQATIGTFVFFGAALALAADARFAVIPLFAGGGLLFAGLTGKCGLALLLAKMPWNRQTGHGSSSCCPANSHSPKI